MVSRPSPSLQARCSLRKHGGTRLITRRPLSGSRPLASVLGRARRASAARSALRVCRTTARAARRRCCEHHDHGSRHRYRRAARRTTRAGGAQDTFYVGNLKGVSRVYQQTFIDPYAVARPRPSQAPGARPAPATALPRLTCRGLSHASHLPSCLHAAPKAVLGARAPESFFNRNPSRNCYDSRIWS